MRFTMSLVGRTALLMHNPRMIDPGFELNIKIKELTKKKNKTIEDHKKIEQLEWLGGLYTEGSNGDLHVVQPTSKVRKCLVEAARITKEGKNVERAVSFGALNVRLEYKGPQSPDALYKSDNFINRLPVVVGGKRVMRARPSFLPWALDVDGMMLPDAGLNPADLERVAKLAGDAIGIGDNRINGYGRFDVTVKWID